MPHKQIVKIQCNLIHNSLLYIKYKGPNFVRGGESQGNCTEEMDAIRSKSEKTLGSFPGERAVRRWVVRREEYFVEIRNHWRPAHISIIIQKPLMRLRDHGELEFIYKNPTTKFII